MPEGAFGYNLKIPESLRSMIMWLCQDTASLHYKWHFYLELFSEEENTALLSHLAQSSFQIIEESLRSDLTMSICRLSDPIRSAGKDNLSLQTLVQECADIDRIDELLREFLDACDPVRQYRNKRVGHNDLDVRIEPRNHPIPGIGRKDIDRILVLAARILNAVYQNFVDTELVFDHPIMIGGADALIYWLKLAKKYQNVEISERQVV